MVHEMMPAPEFAVTFVAGERLFALVNKNMCFELIGVGEARQANVTFVRTFAGVNP